MEIHLDPEQIDFFAGKYRSEDEEAEKDWTNEQKAKAYTVNGLRVEYRDGKIAEEAKKITINTDGIY